MAEIYKLPSELPKFGLESVFWKVAGSTELREVVAFRLINELSGRKSEELTNEQCRSRLAKLEGIASMLFLQEAAKNTNEADKLDSLNKFDQIPED